MRQNGLFESTQFLLVQNNVFLSRNCQHGHRPRAPRFYSRGNLLTDREVLTSEVTKDESSEERAPSMRSCNRSRRIRSHGCPRGTGSQLTQPERNDQSRRESRSG